MYGAERRHFMCDLRIKIYVYYTENRGHAVAQLVEALR
jgi:hypothetical protein